ncbi:MAG: DNA topoisomerase IV, alpha subunit [Aureobasidium pullulans]|nr:MAG: DNA topoisomerase IV, alpha subunit [Aureobasidium pullulans]
MGLEDFEKELAATKSKESDRKRHSTRDDREGHGDEERRRHRHHHRSSRHDESDSRHKRRHHRERDDDEDRRERHSKRRRSRSPRPARPQEDDDQEDDDWVEKEAMTAPPTEDTLDEQLEAATDKNLKRDTWMEAPSALNTNSIAKYTVKTWTNLPEIWRKMMKRSKMHRP